MNYSLSPLIAGFIAAEWVLRFFMLFIVPRKQRPSSANAWLLLIMVLPTVGTVVFLLFGNPKLTKVRMRKQKTVDRLTAKELSELRESESKLFSSIENENHRTLARLATVLGGLPPMNGNSVEFMSDYNEIIDKISLEIDNAKEYVHIEYFISVLDPATKPLFESLKNAVDRGVKVRFLYDRVVSRHYDGHKLMRDFFEDSGIEYRETLPLSLIPGKNFTRPDLRNHRKIVVIDGSVAFSGSQNLIEKSYNRKDNLTYKELVVKLRGPIVWQYNNVFRSDWYAETGQELLEIVEDSDMPKKAGSVIAQVLASGPSHENENNLKFYTSMVYAAKERIGIVVPYFIPDESFLDALTAAAQRGVDVTIINSEAIDKTLAGHAQRSYYDELLEAGVNIFMYREPEFLHTKQVIIDDEVAIIGSSNLDIRSFELDLEVNVVLYDRKVVKNLEKVEQEYLDNCYKLTSKLWQNRKLRVKMLESIARLTAALQ